MINHNQNPFFAEFLIVFAFLVSFARVFERQVRVAHLHSAARALSSPSCDKDFFGCFLC